MSDDLNITSGGAISVDSSMIRDIGRRLRTVGARLGDAAELVDRARAIYLESGYTPEAFDTLVGKTETEVAAQLSSTDPAMAPPYSFEDCAALIGL